MVGETWEGTGGREMLVTGVGEMGGRILDESWMQGNVRNGHG